MSRGTSEFNENRAVKYAVFGGLSMLIIWAILTNQPFNLFQ